MELNSFIIILFIGVIGGVFNTFVGAGSLLTIPTLIILGLPPHVSIGTNRLGVIGSDIAGWYEFHRKKMIDYRAAISLALPTLAGAIIGANLVLDVNEVLLNKIIGGITLSILVLILVMPKLGIENTADKNKRYHHVIAPAITLIIGIYGGFYGAGAGTLLIYVLILFYGQTFIESAGTHALANLSFSVTAASIFAYSGIINYSWVVPLFIGSFAGSFLSAFYAERIGNRWIKRFFVAIVLLVVIKLLM